MKKNLEIIEFEDKITKAGKTYSRFKTNEGWMSCFDLESCKMLKKYQGNSASVEVLEQGDFKNIKKCYGEAGNEDSQVEVVKIGDTKASNNKNATMYVSYAKDIFIAASIENSAFTMNQAIALVKEAKEAFE